MQCGLHFPTYYPTYYPTGLSSSQCIYYKGIRMMRRLNKVVCWMRLELLLLQGTGDYSRKALGGLYTKGRIPPQVFNMCLIPSFIRIAWINHCALPSIKGTLPPSNIIIHPTPFIQQSPINTNIHFHRFNTTNQAPCTKQSTPSNNINTNITTLFPFLHTIGVFTQ